MANISLKTLITEAEDFKARSKETGKLVHFKSKDSYDSALKAGTHEDPKAEKDKAPKASTKSNDMFGGDYAKDRGGDAPKVDGMATVNAIAAGTGLRAQAVAGWADENGVNLSKIAADLKSKKLKPMDFMTAVSGNPGNKYAKDIIAKYSNTSAAPKVDVKSIVNGLLKTANKEFGQSWELKHVVDDMKDSIDTSDRDGKELKARLDKGDEGVYVQTDETEGTVVFNDGSQYQFHHVEDGPIPVTKVGSKNSTKLTSMLPKKDKSITDIKVDKQVDVAMISKSILPNLRVSDGSGYPDKDAVELKKRLDGGDTGVYTRTSPSGGNIIFKDGTRFEVFRPHDFTKTKSTTIYASKR
jgi:hypothetical protein